MDWIAGGLELVGLWLLGNKNRLGFLAGLSCNVMWILYVIDAHATFGLLLAVVPLAFVNVRNFRKWGKSDGG